MSRRGTPTCSRRKGSSSGNTDNGVSAGDVVRVTTGTITASDVLMPFASATYLEQYEGMLVRFPQDLVIAESFNYQFGARHRAPARG